MAPIWKAPHGVPDFQRNPHPVAMAEPAVVFPRRTWPLKTLTEEQLLGVEGRGVIKGGWKIPELGI